MSVLPFAHLPLAEVERRARLIGTLAEVEATQIADAVRYGWENGAGDVTAWYFRPDGTALLITFDHESPLSRYPDWDLAGQLSFFDGLPAGLRALVVGQPEDDLLPTITSDGDDATEATTATGVAWFDGSTWRVAEGLERYCAQHGHSLTGDTGLEFCLLTYHFDGPLTVEELEEDGDPDDVASALASGPRARVRTWWRRRRGERD